jgi:magnesium-transporting ATPase (P-type)
VIVVAASVAFSAEAAASRVIHSVRSLCPPQCVVVRGGVAAARPSAALVPGDAVRLRLGNKVPADIVLLGAEGLHCEVAALTGESVAVECGVERRSDVPLEARNLVFASTLIVGGEGWGLVVRTGDATLVGTIAGAAGARVKRRRPLLEEEMARLVTFVCALSLVTGITFLAIGLGRSLGVVFSITQAFILTIVANCPEGLPASVVVALAKAQQACAARRVVVKEAASLLTLGSVSVLCTDKTGTLTQNKMTVTALWAGGAFVDTTVNAPAPTSPAPAPAPAPPPAAAPADHVARTLRGRRLSLGGGGTAILHSTSLSSGSPSLRHRHHHTEAATGAVVPPGPALHALHSALERQRSLGAPPQLRRAPSWHPPPAAPHPAGASPLRPWALGEGGAALRGLDRASGALAWASANTFTQLLAAAAVCNKAVFAGGGGGGGGGALLGDASDAALARFSHAHAPLAAWRAALPVLFSVPFNSVAKVAFTICALPADPRTHLLLLKGAPERVLALCGGAARDGGEGPLDEAFHADFVGAYERFAAAGGRVLGFAARAFPARQVEEYAAAAAAAAAGGGGGGGGGDPPFPTSDLAFLGIASLADPPREGVAAAVAACRAASIRVTMVTGDHPLTAEAIARQVGIITQPTEAEVGGGGGGGGGGGIAVIGGGGAGAAPPHPPARALILTGFALSELSEAALAEALRVHDEVVFARTSPEQKMRIVAAYQAAGACVAVTGDGTNDAPALRAADVGVAMGSAAASDVAREAADVIVVDDNFVSIVEAIRVGRAAFNNLRKLIAFTVSHAVPELVPVFCLLVFDVPSMLSPLCVLVVDLITEQLPAMYGFGAPPAQEPSARARPTPSPPKTRTHTHTRTLTPPKTPHEP